MLSGIDTFNIFNNEISYKLVGGDFWNYDADDFLRTNNLDYQGLTGSLHYKGYSIGLLVIGDLATNIGLGLHQLHKFFIKKSFNKFHTTFYLDENQLATWENHVVPKDYNLGNHMKLKISDKIELRSQIEMRLNEELGNSLAVGLGISGSINKLKYSGKLKYYQADYNLGYKTNRNEFRNGRLYIGDQLYPIKNFFRTYSQWSNYTKMQNNDLLGLEVNVNWEKKIWKRLLVFVEIDFNIIGDLKTKIGGTTPMYYIGLKKQHFDFLQTAFFITNKHMNINTFYQTFQASEFPFLGASVFLEIEEIKLRDFKIL